jgi:hypothetical protein
MLGALLVVAVQATPAFAAPPTATAWSPVPFGTWQGGIAMKITGTNFTQPAASNTVMFGNVPGTVTNVDPAGTTLSVTTPANPSTAAGTSVAVTVQNSNGISSPTSTVAGVTWTSGSACLTGTFTGDTGQQISGGTGLPANAVITAVGGTGNTCLAPNATINAPTTAAQSTAATVTLTFSFTYPSCTFNNQIAGAVLTVVPGVSLIHVSCMRLDGAAQHLSAMVSSVAGVDTPFSVAADEALIMNNSPSLPPANNSDGSGTLTVDLPVPAKTTGGNLASTAVDPDGPCPPTQFTVNQGLFTCAVAVANLGGVNFGNALLEYPGQLSPQTPTLALSQGGSSTTTVSATGDGWWGTGPDSGTIPASRIRIGCTGTPCIGGQNAVTSNLKVSTSTYFINCPSGAGGTCNGNFQPTRLSGTFTIPTGATGTVAIDQPTRQPAPCAAPQNCFPGNGPGRSDTAATVTLNSPTVLDAGIQASDIGDTVTGTGIPAGTFVGTVTAGTSFLLSSSATSQVNVNATANGTGVVIGSSVEATAAGVATATATGTGVATWLGNDPNNAIANSGDNPDPNQFWQPVAAATAPLTYTVTLPAATTISAVTENWFKGAFLPPTGWTVDTSTTGPAGTFTTQLTVSGNTSASRTDVFPGGHVTGVNAIRLSGITGFGAPCSGCGWAPIALVKFGWDGHGVVFPQATSPNTTPWRPASATPAVFGSPIITTASSVGVAGTTPYGYKVTALTGNGETLASAEGKIANGNAILSATNFNQIFWTAIPGAASYNVYGRTQGAEQFLANVPASATTCAPSTAPVPPCFSDTGTSTPVTGAVPPTDPGTDPSTALNNPNNAAFFWQPTSAAAAGADYEVDLGSPTVLDSVTPSWGPYFAPPSAYEIDTSNDGVTWMPQFTTTSNKSFTAPDVFPAGQVTANYVRLQINAPFPGPTGTGFAAVALLQLSWNGLAPTFTGTPPATSVAPTGYYPATLPNVATANTTTTWNAQSQNNGVFGGTTQAHITGGSSTCCSTTSGSGVITATAAAFTATDVGKPIRATSIPVGAIVTTFTSTTSITVSLNATATASGVLVTLGGNSWWQPANTGTTLTGNLVVAYDLGSPRTVNSVTTSWLTGASCPGHGTCSGFEGVAYQILTSPNGTQNSWTVCATQTTNSSFTTTDTCTVPATGAQYVEFFITQWNSTTPVQPNDGYGPAFNSILIQ